jgi:uncharacterized protein (TIGR02266 family)
MDGPDELRFRDKTRAPLEVPVRLQLDSFAEPENGFTANVSPGGMFVAQADPKPVGTRVRFWLELPGETEPVPGFGEVVWLRPVQTSAERPPGMGIEFRYLDDKDQDRIRAEVLRIAKDLALPEEPSLSEEAALEARRVTPLPSPAPSGPPPDTGPDDEAE